MLKQYLIQHGCQLIYCDFFPQNFLINRYLTNTSSPDNACHVVRLLPWNILQLCSFGMLARITCVVLWVLVNSQFSSAFSMVCLAGYRCFDVNLSCKYTHVLCVNWLPAVILCQHHFLSPRDGRSGGILFLSCLSFCHSVIL